MGVRYFPGRVSYFNQSEPRKQCLLYHESSGDEKSENNIDKGARELTLLRQCAGLDSL